MSTRFPFCSLIVPTHRRPRALAECLDALAALDYPEDRLEVVVVDDGGDVALEPVLEAIRPRLATALIRQARQGPAGARNSGARLARGELLAFTDDDCRPAPDWLRRLAEAHQREPRAMLGGHTRNALRRNALSTTSQLIIDAGYEWHNNDPADARFLTSNNMAVPAADFADLGGFDAAFTTSEDRDLCDRWVVSGRSIRYLPEAIVEHAHRLTPRSFCRQHFAYGRGARRFHSEHRRRTGLKIPIEPRFYLGVHHRALGQSGEARRLDLQLALILWHGANLAGFLWQKWRPSGEPHAGRASGGIR